MAARETGVMFGASVAAGSLSLVSLMFRALPLQHEKKKVSKSQVRCLFGGRPV